MERLRTLLDSPARERFAAECTKPGVLLRLRADDPRIWDLSKILPG